MKPSTKIVGASVAGLLAVGLVGRLTGLTADASSPTASPAPASPTAPDVTTVPAPGRPAPKAPAWPAPTTPAPTPTETTPPAPRYVTPKPTDFDVIIMTSRSECALLGGCTIAYRPSLRYFGQGRLDPWKTYEVTFEVFGGEGFPRTDTLAWTGNMGETRVAESYASTASRSVFLDARVTDVRLRFSSAPLSEATP